MEPWVLKAVERWPNVPALFGWLGLDRRGRWLIRGETISHPRIVDTISRNYGCDEHGRWYFQNGPQRGYVALASAPFLLRVHDGELRTHTDVAVRNATAAFMDEDGSLILSTECGPGELGGAELDWALGRLSCNGRLARDEEIFEALQGPSGSQTSLSLEVCGATLAVARLDFAEAPEKLKFVRAPAPLAGERAASGAPD